MSELRVWTCKIVVDDNKPFPNGFDYPPRRAVIEAIEDKGFNVVECFSGWGGSLTKAEKAVMNDDDDAFLEACNEDTRHYPPEVQRVLDAAKTVIKHRESDGARKQLIDAIKALEEKG